MGKRAENYHEERSIQKKNITLVSKQNTELKKKTDVVLYREHFIVCLRDVGTKAIAAEIFGELRNLVLEEKREDKVL